MLLILLQSRKQKARNGLLNTPIFSQRLEPACRQNGFPGQHHLDATRIIYICPEKNVTAHQVDQIALQRLAKLADRAACTKSRFDAPAFDPQP